MPKLRTTKEEYELRERWRLRKIRNILIDVYLDLNKVEDYLYDFAAPSEIIENTNRTRRKIRNLLEYYNYGLDEDLFKET